MYARPYRDRAESSVAPVSASPPGTGHAGGSASDRLPGLLEEASTLLLAQFPAAPPALRPEIPLREALQHVLPEPCALEVAALSPRTAALILTPQNGHAFDPLLVHAMIARLRSRLAERGYEPEGGLEIVPLARIGPATAQQENLAALNELLETLVHKRMGVQFQPIVSFAAGRVFGYEALMRAPQGGALKRVGTLFLEAERARLVTWLDVACQERCFEAAAQCGIRDHLFINMDAEGLSYLDDADRSLADRAAEYGIAPDRIVLEITERQTVEDFPRLVTYIEGLRAQGIKIAIDDAGDGYNSLRAIAELRPDFVKIARSLVKSIENSGPRRALLETLAQYTSQIGASLIAEGIETRDELTTVIEAGADFGQGYLLGKPNDGFKGLRREMREFVAERRAHRQRRSAGRSYVIGLMARCGVTLPPETPLELAARKFARTPELESIVVATEERVEGLLMRYRFEALWRTGGADASRPIAEVMDRQPLTVEADTPLEEAAQRTTFRQEMRFQDDLLVTRHGQFAGVVPMRALVEALTRIKE